MIRITIAALLLVAFQDPKMPPKQDPAPAPAGAAKVATEVEAEAAIAAFKKAYAVDLTSAKKEAIKKVAETRHEKVIKELIPLMGSGVEDIAATAAIQLGSLDHPSAAAGLANAASVPGNLKRPVVFASICSSIAKLQYELCAPVLNKIIDKSGDEDAITVMGEVFSAVGKIGSASSVDPLIDFLRKAEQMGGGGGPGGGGGRYGGGGGSKQAQDLGKLRGPCRAALGAITGGQEDTATKWSDWWKASKATLIAEARPTLICKLAWERIEQTDKKKPPCPKVAEKGHDGCLAHVHTFLVAGGGQSDPRGGGGSNGNGNGGGNGNGNGGGNKDGGKDGGKKEGGDGKEKKGD